MHRHLHHLFVILFFCALGALVAVYAPVAGLLVMVLGALVWALSYRPVVGLYVLLFLYPFLGWTIDFSRYEALQNTVISNVNAPLADFWAVILMAAVVVGWVRTVILNSAKPSEGSRTHGGGLTGSFASLRMTVLFFILFLFSALISLFNLPVGDTLAGVKYILRNIVFTVVAYVGLPLVILSSAQPSEGSRTHEGNLTGFFGASPLRMTVIRNCIRTLLIAGGVALVWGIASLFVVPSFWGIWRRVTPFAISGFAPLGLFHNDLAEVLVAIIPFALFWYYKQGAAMRSLDSPARGGLARDDKKTGGMWRKISFLYAALLIIITLLTFSRTAWVVMFVQVVAFMVLSTRNEWRAVARAAAPFAAVLVIPIAVYMLVFSSSAYVASSTSARADLARIAGAAFEEHPIIGNGAGTYISLVAQSRAFRIEYGPPFDAHGVIQKLAAEQGVLGLTTFALFVIWLLYIVLCAYRRARPGTAHKELMLALFVIAFGAAVYQVFNTQYYTAKMWMPIGFAIAVAMIKSK